MRWSKAAPPILFLVISYCSLDLDGRSMWRTKDPLMPTLTTRWADGTTTYRLRTYYLELHPVFSKFDFDYFMNHLVPEGPISYRTDPSKSVDGTLLKKLAEEVVQEIKRKKTVFKHFTTIKKSNFNERLSSGLIILKYKAYPFVLKLFVKTPETFVKQSEGIIPTFFFRMGGGINRHLSGFTRIKNVEEIQKKIDGDPFWAARIDTPRKWFWLPKKSHWIELRGTNIGPEGEPTTKLPATYGIIADEIKSDKTLSLRKGADRETALEFAHYVGNRVDAHVDNFMREKVSGKIVLVDTEHFPTMIGLKEPMYYEDYTSWYKQLINKCLKDTFLRHKKLRRELQWYPQRELLPC